VFIRGVANLVVGQTTISASAARPTKQRARREVLAPADRNWAAIAAGDLGAAWLAESAINWIRGAPDAKQQAAVAILAAFVASTNKRAKRSGPQGANPFGVRRAGGRASHPLRGGPARDGNNLSKLRRHNESSFIN